MLDLDTILMILGICLSFGGAIYSASMKTASKPMVHYDQVGVYPNEPSVVTIEN